jgi:hypothetical protein
MTRLEEDYERCVRPGHGRSAGDADGQLQAPGATSINVSGVTAQVR